MRVNPRGFPCNKPCDLTGDAEALGLYLRTIDRYPDALEAQHPVRRWEYAMALRTIQAWSSQQVVDTPLDAPTPGPLQICDVGGGGSNFWQILTGLTSEDILIIDPVRTPEMTPLPGQRVYAPGSVEAYAACTPPHRFDVLTCISVIEHVLNLPPFFRACHHLLKPGGLLVLTTDYWDGEGEDTAHFHWMRKRIYTTDRIQELRQDLRRIGFTRFGEEDWTYPGPQLYDYSVASVAVVTI